MESNIQDVNTTVVFHSISANARRYLGICEKRDRARAGGEESIPSVDTTSRFNNGLSRRDMGLTNSGKAHCS